MLLEDWMTNKSSFLFLIVEIVSAHCVFHCHVQYIHFESRYNALILYMQKVTDHYLLIIYTFVQRELQSAYLRAQLK